MKILSWVKDRLYRWVTSLRLFKKLALLYGQEIATTGRDSRACLDLGFLPMPVHYYSPLPDLNDLERRKIWDKKTPLAGINFNVKQQYDLLNRLSRYSDECVWPSVEKKEGEYYVDGNVFGYGCAASTYSMIRMNKPKRVIEIGSGFSSKVIAQALQKNIQENGGYKIDYKIIDPFPSEQILNKKIFYTKLIKERVEDVDLKIFDKLGKNDILFIDSSHSLKIGGDVFALYLEILPRLAKGVMIHIHDIELPYEYSRAYATNESFRQFWTEQYVLQAFLCLNPSFKIILGMKHIMKDNLKYFRQCFPFHKRIHDKVTSGSFWIKRIN